MEAVEKKQQPEKMSYEQLENVAHQLSEQSRQMYQQLQQANMSNFFTRLNYLFEVVKLSDKFPSEFVVSTIDEIVEALTIPKEDTENADA